MSADFESLFQRLYPSLHRYLCRMTGGDADLAEDIAQEAFVRLLGQSLPEDEARPWLFTVSTNLLRDWKRKSVRRDRLLSTARVLPTPFSRPDESAEAAERIERVRSALDRIPERDRTLLLMREEGFKYEEIAKVVGVAPGSVGTLLARALRRFSTAIGADEDGGDDAPE